MNTFELSTIGMMGGLLLLYGGLCLLYLPTRFSAMKRGLVLLGLIGIYVVASWIDFEILLDANQLRLVNLVLVIFDWARKVLQFFSPPVFFCLVLGSFVVWK